ncbi:MAG TPA: hypothetical protein ENH10_10680 [Bacteroidetes bacterium]|nr:hypothetical protein [Bacteroidota bacterium]HEX05598.1 hypothetical protein [Bacteroidota bacterium]
MDHDKSQDVEFASELKSGRFAPSSDDAAFLETVKRGVKVRRRNRVVRNSVISSLAVVVLVVALINGGSLFGPDYKPLITDDNWTASGLTSEDLELLLTQNVEEFFSFESDGNSTVEQLTQDLAFLFDSGDFYDPVEFFASYDEDLQERVLAQMKDLDVLDVDGLDQWGEI